MLIIVQYFFFKTTVTVMRIMRLEWASDCNDNKETHKWETVQHMMWLKWEFNVIRLRNDIESCRQSNMNVQIIMSHTTVSIPVQNILDALVLVMHQWEIILKQLAIKYK